MDIRELNFEVIKHESTKGVESAQAATVTLYEDWLGIESVDVSVQKGLSTLFSSSHTQKEKMEKKKKLRQREAHKALKKYCDQGESRKSDHQTNLIQTCQIWNIVV